MLLSEIITFLPVLPLLFMKTQALRLLSLRKKVYILFLLFAVLTQGIDSCVSRFYGNSYLLFHIYTPIEAFFISYIILSGVRRLRKSKYSSVLIPLSVYLIIYIASLHNLKHLDTLASTIEYKMLFIVTVISFWATLRPDKWYMCTSVSVLLYCLINFYHYPEGYWVANLVLSIGLFFASLFLLNTKGLESCLIEQRRSNCHRYQPKYPAMSRNLQETNLKNTTREV